MSVYRFAGDWNNVATYAPNFVVVSNGLAYVAKETVTGGGEPSTNLAQWTYLPAGQQTAATFPVIEGDVSLSVDETSNLVISAGAANVQVTSPLLVSGLFNNAGNDPPPVDGQVLTWRSPHIEWETPVSSSTSFKQDAGSLTWSTVGSYFYTKFAVPAYGTTTVTSNAAPQVTLGAINSSNAPTSGDANNWINCWIANSYAFNDSANSNAYSLYVTAAANPTGLSNVLMNVFIPSP